MNGVGYLIATADPYALLAIGASVGACIAVVVGIELGAQLERGWFAARGVYRSEYRG